MKNLCFVFVFALISFCTMNVHSTSVLPQSAQSLYRNSQYIVKGTVKDISVEKHETLDFPVEHITIQVEETIKGELPDDSGELVFTQMYQGTHFNDKGQFVSRTMFLPKYVKGKKYVFCISKPGRLGLTSTVGLHYGLFQLDDEDKIRFFNRRLPVLQGKAKKTNLFFSTTANQNDYQKLKSIFQNASQETEK